MTHLQQTKLAELLVNKLKQAHNQPYEELLPPSALQNQIRQQMVMAGVVYELMKEAYTSGWRDGFRNGICRGDGNYSRPNRADYEEKIQNLSKI